MWEWIYPDSKPQSRPGLAYADFAYKNRLTPLNYLNSRNYNPHLIRWDLGGIQKEYYGRRWVDLLRTIVFYTKRLRRQGFSFLLPYLTKESLQYVILRLIRLLVPHCQQPRSKAI